ncbi:MAG: ACT domain-containing protein [Desulfatiglandaceae bacterium]|jgi:glycine cleavage system transcriptional repressor
MKKRFIMTAFGKDRPGILAEVSQVVYENGCNLEDSTMTILADEFAMILLLEGREEGQLEKRLLSDCRRLEREKGISAFVHEVVGEKRTAQKETSLYVLRVEGLDQAGIVYKISRYLADHHINVSNLNSRMDYSPDSGAAIYTMEIQIEVPAGMTENDLDSGLTQVGNALNVDISLVKQ